MCLNTLLDLPRRGRPTSCLIVTLTCLIVAGGADRAAGALREESPAVVVANDNTRPAGRTDQRTVTIRLRAARGRWQPEGPEGPALTIDAFGEEGRALMVPAPFIRAAEGTTIVLSIRNDLDAALTMHGLCTRDGRACDPIDVPPGSDRSVRFVTGRAGTYHYWATSMAAPVPFRELAGALVVDPPDGPTEPDRIFVITEWNSFTPSQLREVVTADDPSERFLALDPRFTFVINGLSWPATERLTYHSGETVRWRVINLSSQMHPMHLHGFYFRVMRLGDGRSDEPVAGGQGNRVVTQLLPAGGTLLMEWTPEREGNWLFHCHIMAHVSPERRLDQHAPLTSTPAGDDHSQHHDRALGMSGMVLGITVLPSLSQPMPATGLKARRITMFLGRTRDSQRRDTPIGVAIGDQPASVLETQVSSPGPPIVLTRGEPVEIDVLNGLSEPTSIHWHGLEIDSYYDGVHGWSGMAGQTAPMIDAGGSFVVRITPARAGTFIYHTHLHTYPQLSSGLYGALVVTEPGETHDPATDHVFVLGRRDASLASSVLTDPDSVLLNGERTPRWTWSSGRRHRLRFINITADDILTVSLVQRDAPVTWRPLTKDGATVSTEEKQTLPAKVTIAVGETYDFEFDAPAGRATLWLEVRSTSGKWQAQGQVIVK
jgi:FtsP/CotA-like multicopper oxidase with cupredoxin domain